MPRKKDWAEKQTDQMLSELEGRINDEYSTAYKELSKKCDKYFSGFEKRDAVKLSQVSAGQISQEEYKEWRKNQMLIGQRWSDMVDTMAKDLTKVDQKVISMTRGFLPEAYALNHNYGTYEGEKSTHVDTAYTLYDRHTVEKLLRDQPNMLPALKPNSPTARKLAERKDLIWNKQHINSAITQGVLQGDDLKNVSKRLQSVTDMDNKAAKRNARTMMTGAQNSGRLDSYKRMQEMGIEVQKQWMATLDHYTRSSHAHLDGEKVDIDKKFANGLQYPGDKDGRPEEVYNCRCTMIAYFPEYEYENMQRYDNIEGKPIDEVTYAEWAGWKEKKKKVLPDITGVFVGVPKLQDIIIENVVKGCNPDYIKEEYDMGTHENCAYTSTALELRYRGYDVYAKHAVPKNKIRSFRYNYYGRPSDPRYREELITGEGSFTDCFGGMKIDRVDSRRKSQSQNKVIEKMQSYGEDSRAIIFVEWENGGGHYFNAVNNHGKVEFLDGQNGSMDCSDYFNHAKPSKIRVFRTDNCKITDYFKEVVNYD